MYTDGSAEEGRSNGGAACVVTTGGCREPRVVEVIERPAGGICSSFQAEMLALESGVTWLRENREMWRRARIVSDSQSSLKAVMNRKAKGASDLVEELWDRLEEVYEEGKVVTLTWVPSHCGIVGNEMADAAADRASKMEQAGVRCSLDGVKRRLTRIEERDSWTHERSKRTYGGVRWKRQVEEEWSREESVSYARFRCGHSLELEAYRKRIGVSETDRCPRCEEEAETVEHVLVCGAGEAKRWELGIQKLSDLIEKPREGIAFWRWWKRKRWKTRSVRA